VAIDAHGLGAGQFAHGACPAIGAGHMFGNAPVREQ